VSTYTGVTVTGLVPVALYRSMNLAHPAYRLRSAYPFRWKRTGWNSDCRSAADQRGCRRSIAAAAQCNAPVGVGLPLPPLTATVTESACAGVMLAGDGVTVTVGVLFAT